MRMWNVVSLLWPRRRASDTVPVRSTKSVLSARMGDIGPVRKEIIFEPVPEIPAPRKPPVETPTTPAKEPVPARP
jgi:hypothetical protein